MIHIVATFLPPLCDYDRNQIHVPLDWQEYFPQTSWQPWLFHSFARQWFSKCLRTFEDKFQLPFDFSTSMKCFFNSGNDARPPTGSSTAVGVFTYCLLPIAN